MLTMGKPIQVKSARPVGMLGDMFGERIRGNYEQMQGYMSPADMLHFLSVPPEVYMAGAVMTPPIYQQNMAEIPNIKLSLVNNVLNRILVFGHMELSYQDRVFVENTLKKLGVTDVQEFMRQVQMMKEETGNVRELLFLYESGQDMIRLMQEYHKDYSQEQKRKEAWEETKAEEAVRSLSVSVLNRLHIAAIYRELNSYAVRSFAGRVVLDRREMAFCEQDMAASYLSLNEYRSRIFAQEQNLVYNQPNIYEAGDASQVDETYEQIVNRLLQASLFNAISQIFHNRYRELTQHADWRHEFMDVLHVSARNTFQRFKSLHNRIFFAVQEKDKYHQLVRDFERQEIHFLRTLLADRTQVINNMPHAVLSEKEAVRYRTEFMETHEGDTHIDAVRQETVWLQDHPPQHLEEFYKEREEEIRRQLDSINQRNKERMERLLAYTSRIEEPEKLRINRERAKTDALRVLGEPKQVMLEYLERETESSEETKQETEKLREILGDETIQVFETIRGYQENPGRYSNVVTSEGQAVNLLMRDIAEEMAHAQKESAQDEGVLRSGQETVWRQENPLQNLEELYKEREEEIRRQLDSINQQNKERMERLLAYTSRIEEPEKLRINRERAKTDALRVLGEPKQVVLEYLERETEHSEETKQETEKLREILGDETVQVFETIRGYQENPGQYSNVVTSEGQAVNLLMRDIADTSKPPAVISAAEPEMIVYNEGHPVVTEAMERAFNELAPSAGALRNGQKETPGQEEKAVELLHRQSEQTVSEETLQKWMQTWKRDAQIRNADVQKWDNEENQVTEIVQSKVNEMMLKQDEEIGRIISQNVRQQLDMMSEKVYGKLERRMDTEKRRRGL